MSDNLAMPIVETYRGIGIHDFQPPDRIQNVIKPAIDAVYGLSDPLKLVAFAKDSRQPPEARLFAAARCEAIWELAAANREIRPNIDLQFVRAIVAGLGSLKWLQPSAYTSLLDPSRDTIRRDPENAERAERAREFAARQTRATVS
ncbi:hypothetical protein ASG43_17730 [Aureimonas sp. Leaf454]|uniref:hypothetical protein n=1 Tax=Aureimonas sp. Leaf454 TaxID=1736381 RepID=UPI0006F2DE0C|nr:hypothetical protein [Aureimonas sp. Leaf454]KQT53677.1 hypothetical protein ASG43_17730 [Aureimonas sp. Leaf454]